MKFETQFDPEDFWTYFGFVLIRKLADRSVESGCPIIFS
jgi:hypothetical protein